MPPRIATWLLDLCVAPNQSDTILGDLSEEFTVIATNLGMAAARRWYWRQATKTVAGSLLAQVQQRPWLFLAIALVGWLLPRVYGIAIERAVTAVHARWQVYVYIDAYSFWLLYGVLLRSTIVPMVTGWLVATVVKSRPIGAALVLAGSAALGVLIPASLFVWRGMQYWPTHPVLARIDRGFFFELVSLTSVSFIATLAGAVVARKYQPVDTCQPAAN
jgi:hypothetical protein